MIDNHRHVYYAYAGNLYQDYAIIRLRHCFAKIININRILIRGLINLSRQLINSLTRTSQSHASQISHSLLMGITNIISLATFNFCHHSPGIAFRFNLKCLQITLHPRQLNKHIKFLLPVAVAETCPYIYDFPARTVVRKATSISPFPGDNLNMHDYHRQRQVKPLGDLRRGVQELCATSGSQIHRLPHYM